MTRSFSLLFHKPGNRQVKLCAYTRRVAKAALYTSHLDAEHREGIPDDLNIPGKYRAGVTLLPLFERPRLCPSGQPRPLRHNHIFNELPELLPQVSDGL